MSPVSILDFPGARRGAWPVGKGTRYAVRVAAGGRQRRAWIRRGGLSGAAAQGAGPPGRSARRTLGMKIPPTRGSEKDILLFLAVSGRCGSWLQKSRMSPFSLPGFAWWSRAGQTIMESIRRYRFDGISPIGWRGNRVHRRW